MWLRTLQEWQTWAVDVNWARIACDTETNGLDWYTLDIWGASFADGHNSCYVNLLDNPDKDAILEDMWQRLLSTKTLIGHNLAFDLKVLLKVYGEKVNQWIMGIDLVDTYCADYLLDERTKHSLKGPGGCLDRHLGRNAMEFKEADKAGPKSKIFAEYAEADAVNTLDLWNVLRPKLIAEDLGRVFSLECKFIPVLVEMESNGVYCDKEQMVHIGNELNARKYELLGKLDLVFQDELRKADGFLFGVDSAEDTFNSPAKTTRFLNDKLGFRVDNADIETMEACAEHDERLKIVMEYHRVSKLLSTYIDGLDRYIAPDSRVRPSYKTISSGRLSCCVPLSAEILTAGGWKRYNTLQVGEKVLGYNILTKTYKWTELQGVNIFSNTPVGLIKANKGHDKKYANGLWCTQNHRWVIEHPGLYGFIDSDSSTKRTYEKLLQPRTEFPEVDKSLLSPQEAAMLGWFLTDGSLVRTKGGFGLSVQLVKNRSVQTFKSQMEGIQYSQRTHLLNKKHPELGERQCFYIGIDIFSPIYKQFMSFDPSELVLRLSRYSRKQMLLAMLEADGSMRKDSDRYDRFGAEEHTQKKADQYFEILSVACGQPYTTRRRKTRNGKDFREYTLLKSAPLLAQDKNNRWRPDHEEPVWCPTTACGTWIMRQGPWIVVTGNSSPNLQNQPKETDEVAGVDARSIWKPFPGKKFLRADYSQFQLRIAAHNANDANMLKAFSEGYDVHMLVANKGKNLGISAADLKETSPKFKEIKKTYEAVRTQFKAANFGLLFERSANNLAKDWKSTKEEAQAVIDSVFAMFPFLKAHKNKWHEFIRNKGYSMTMFGRRRRFHRPVTESDLRAGWVSSIQGSEADIIKIAMRQVWEYLHRHKLASRLIWQIHDEIIIEGEEEELKDIKSDIEHIMCYAVPLRCPVSVDSNIVSSYSEK